MAENNDTERTINLFDIAALEDETMMSMMAIAELYEMMMGGM